MTRKVKPCVTIPYWKILQDREGERHEEEKESARQAPQQETLLEVVGGGKRGDARRAEPRKPEDRAAKPEAKDEDKSGGRDQPDSDDTLIFETFSGAGQPGPAWVRHSTEGWWWHQASGLLYSEGDRKYFVWEELLQRHVEADPFHAPCGEAGLSLRAEASAAGPEGAPPGRSVVIRDLVAAGQALRTPLQHLDRPSALVALFQGSPGAESAEFYAKNLHAKLLRLLSLYRGFWSEELVRGAFQSALEGLDHEFHLKHAEKARVQNCSCIAVLVLGTRIFVAALGDCRATLFRSRGEGEEMDGVALTEVAGEARVAATPAVAGAGARGMPALRGGAGAVLGRGPGLCVEAPRRDVADPAQRPGGEHDALRSFRFAACQVDLRQFPLHCLVLCAGGDGHAGSPSGSTDTGGTQGLFERRSFHGLLAQRRPRVVAGAAAWHLSGSVEHTAPPRPGRPSRSVSGGDAGGAGGSSSSSSKGCSVRPVMTLAVDFRAQPPEGEEERPPKRQRSAEATGPARIRCRHILLKHRELKQPVDTVRRRRVERSREEAEAMLRELLLALLADSGSFPQVARKHSECTTCLRGGEQAGDLGWLTRGVRGATGVSREVEEAAFLLGVGELSDIVVSDAGVHLVQRIA